MSTFKTISSADIKTTRTNLNQLVDFIEEDISGSLTRKKIPGIRNQLRRSSGDFINISHSL